MTPVQATIPDPQQQEETIAEIIKRPSKVVLLRNMVGPGDVDEELEPEVKEECITKYGEIQKVIIRELENVVPEEDIRTFVEFKKIKSAIKAVVDLNGWLFVGRQVRAGLLCTNKKVFFYLKIKEKVEEVVFLPLLRPSRAVRPWLRVPEKIYS